MSKCEVCTNYMHQLDRCKYCNFEWDEDAPWCRDDDWDIFKLDDNYEWSHLQIMYRLKYKGIDCLSADIWWDDDMAYVLSPDADEGRVARALKIHKDCVYYDHLHGWMILDLYKEKVIRLFDKVSKELELAYEQGAKAGMPTGGIIGEIELVEELAKELGIELDTD